MTSVKDDRFGVDPQMCLKMNLRRNLGPISPTCSLTASAQKDPTSKKRQPSHQRLFVISRSSREKGACKMLVKSTSGVYLTNILLRAFTLADPKRAKKTDGLTVFFLRSWDLCT